MTQNSLLDELDNLTQADLDKAAARKPPFVKIYNHFKARTKREIFSKGGKAQWIRLLWTDMEILNADTPTNISEDTHEFPYLNFPGTEFTFFTEALFAKGYKWADLEGAVVEYKLTVVKQKNPDGTPKMRTYERSDGTTGEAPDDQWYFQVVAIGAGAAAKPSSPAFSDAQMDDAASICAGLSSEDALKALNDAKYPGNDMLSKLLVGSTKRLRQVDGFYTLITEPKE